MVKKRPKNERKKAENIGTDTGFERNISPYVRKLKNYEQDRNSLLSFCPWDRRTDLHLIGPTAMYLVSLESSLKMQGNGICFMLIS